MRKILLIDDDPATTDMLEIQLQSSPWMVISANSGEDGIRIARAEQPDLILLDLMLLDMDGLEICGELRKFTQSPILILSAFYSPDMVARALNAGADDYLSKPVPTRILFAHINSLMRRNSTQDADLVPVKVGAASL